MTDDTSTMTPNQKPDKYKQGIAVLAEKLNNSNLLKNINLGQIVTSGLPWDDLVKKIPEVDKLAQETEWECNYGLSFNQCCNAINWVYKYQPSDWKHLLLDHKLVIDNLVSVLNYQTQTLNSQTQAFEAYEQTWEHIDLVVRYLMSAQVEMMRRAVTHDRTKLISPEREMFAEMTRKLRELTYGSLEYKECLKQMRGQALGHHYSHNRHHPEFFLPREESSEIKSHEIMVQHAMNYNIVLPDDIYGYENLLRYLKVKQLEQTSSINNMNLFDILEMFVDWVAATQRHDDGDINKSIEHNTERFALSPQLVSIFENTVPWIKDAFADLKNQQDL
jgi:hypothetical protein